jgi:hypothetical protein
MLGDPMRLCFCATVVLLLVTSCRTQPTTAAEPPPADLVLSGSSLTEIEKKEGETIFLTETVFLGSALANSPELTVRLEGLSMSQGTEADLYLGNASPTRFDRHDYLGSLATVASKPVWIHSVTRSVHDFEMAGQKFTARSSLKNNAHFSIVVVVKKGSVNVERFVLTATAPTPDAPAPIPE